MARRLRKIATEEAFAIPEVAAEVRDAVRRGGPNLNDPLLAPLRKNPAFAAFIGGVEARAALIGIDYVRELSLTPPKIPLDAVDTSQHSR